MYEIKTSSYDLLYSILDPFIKLAVNLLETIDPSEDENIVTGKYMLTLTALLAGLEKMINVTFQLLYLSKKIDWKWMSNNREVPIGTIQCNRGLSAKLRKLEELGIRKNDMQWVVDLRNEFIHLSNYHIGYKLGLTNDEEPRLELKAMYPEITYDVRSANILTTSIINSSSEDIVTSLATYLDKVKWKDAWRRIVQNIDKLPINPEPEYTRAINSGLDDIIPIIEALNMKYIGVGLINIID